MLDRRSFFKSFIAGVAAVFGYKTASAENHGRLVIMTPGASLDEWGVRSVEPWSQLVDFSMSQLGTAKQVGGNYDPFFKAIQKHTEAV